MTTDLTRRTRRSGAAIAFALLLAALVSGCALDPAPGSGDSMPGGIDYHSGPYRMQNG